MSQELNQALWNSANIMRGSMNADEYKDYLLGLVFYKYLSDRQLFEAVDLLEEDFTTLEEAQKIYEDAQNSEDWEDLQEELKNKFGYAIKPQHTFTALYNEINEKTFTTDNLRQAMRDLEQGGGDLKPYENLFEDFNIDSKSLGTVPAKKNAMLAGVIKELEAINFNEYGEDALGDAYEYLIGEFAAGSGKKAGEFYTPQSVSTLISRIVTLDQKDKYGFSVFDACMGSGSLLLQVRNFVDKKDSVRFFGREKINTTFNLARMNMILHNVKFENQHFNHGDSLSDDWPTDEPTTFDAVCMNPPYSQQWSAAAGFMTDTRFQKYEKLAPKSKADFAFLLHGFYHLKDSGTMGIVLPHGVLFRGAAEGTIRRHLVEDGSIYAVIGLPAGIFFNTGIPTCIIVLKKNRPGRDILFIDASREFKKDKAKNLMLPEHIDKIISAYTARANVDKFARLATYDEIVENDFNLNIPRYVDTFETEDKINLPTIAKNISTSKFALKNSFDTFLANSENLRGDSSLNEFLNSFKAGVTA